MALHPLQESQDGVGGRETFVGRGLGQVMTHDSKREGHALQGCDGVFIGYIVTGEDDSNSENGKMSISSLQSSRFRTLEDH